MGPVRETLFHTDVKWTTNIFFDRRIKQKQNRCLPVLTYLLKKIQFRFLINKNIKNLQKMD